MIKTGEKTYAQLKRVLTKTIEKFPPSEEDLPVTDIIIQVNQSSGDITTFDDDGNEITRANIEEWIGNTSPTFYQDIVPVIRHTLKEMHRRLLSCGIAKPFDILLTDDEGETVADLYSIDEGTVVLTDEDIRQIDEDLDAFLDHLMKE
jgi:hypothetical protein